MRLTFFGGTRTVTGSNFLLDTGQSRILVDCGMQQGCHFCERRNLRDFPYDPKSIDVLLITHAHIDHTGRVPKLVKDGFSGKIFSTPPTKDIAELLLEDSAEIFTQEAKDRGLEPLYGAKDISGALRLWEGVGYDQDFSPVQGVKVRFHEAGHVLGSSIIAVKTSKATLVFSGDLGNPPTPLLRPTEFIDRADLILIESTYGDRIHEDVAERRHIIEDLIEETIKRNGVLLVPAFAFERTQEFLFEINYLVEEKKIPQVPIFIDTPLGIKITKVYSQYEDYFNKEAKYLIERGDQVFQFPGLKFTPTSEESKSINNVPPPKVIIAGSGMINGGRILHHAIRYLPEEQNTLLIIGYQAAGSLGRRILDGASSVKIFGQNIPVKAKIKAIGGYSAHADQEGLIRWLDHFERPIRRVFAVHGEEGPATSLVQRIRDQLGIEASAPFPGDFFEL